MKKKAKELFLVVCNTCEPSGFYVEGKRKLNEVLEAHEDEAYFSKVKGKTSAKSA